MASTADDERASQLRNLAKQARRNGDLAASQALYEEASNLLRDGPNRLEFAHTIRHLGDVYTKLQEWSLAEPYFIEALQIYRSHSSPPPLDLANAVRAYAVLKSAIGPHEQATQLWAEALQLYQEIGIPEGVEECTSRLLESPPSSTT